MTMTLPLLLGWIGALSMGGVLGILGAGGSILTVPILVYGFGMDPVSASAQSLFIVGTTAALGAVLAARKQLVRFQVALLFAAPAMTAVVLVRKIVVAKLPPTLLEWGPVTLTKGAFVMIVFAILMLAAARAMLRPSRPRPEPASHFHGLSGAKLALQQAAQGVGVGALTGLVGAGGGFLIIPALVHFARLNMKEAVGTSLLVIAINSLVGFAGDVGRTTIHWDILLPFAALAFAGMLAGRKFTHGVSNERLKPAFGWFVLAIGSAILLKELI